MLHGHSFVEYMKRKINSSAFNEHILQTLDHRQEAQQDCQTGQGTRAKKE
jgi:hypothetical protein